MDSFQFIDIVFFAMIGAFLVLRLRSVLGRRDHTETGHRDPFAREAPSNTEGDGVKANGADHAADSTVVRLPGRGDVDDGTETVQGVAAITAADPTFDADEFLQGARIAFEMILGAYVEGSKDTLRPLLGEDVMANFAAAIDAREKAGERLEQKLVSIKSATISEAFLEGRVANVSVRFVSEQINAVLNADDEVVDGDISAVVDVTDIWTFARDTGARDPNWILVGTQSPE